MPDVVIAGAGPAGWALASACARLGLATTLVDPEPLKPWQATYGLWADEFPGIPAAASPSVTLAHGTTEHRLDRRYLVVDNAALRESLTDERVDVRIGHVTGAAVGPRGATVTLREGGPIATGVAVDATSHRRALSGGPVRCTEQTAYGVKLTAEEASRLVPDDTTVFMDWGSNGTFLYALPLGDGRVLVEETCLARRPGLPVEVLAGRLHARLAAAGIAVPDEVERVRIPLDLPRPRGLAFGVAAGLVHPATGYSLATSLQLAPRVASALARGLGVGPVTAVRAARDAIWSPRARAVHALRGYGLRALLRMPPERLAEFFELFFRLPIESQRAFTSGREDLTGTAGMMTELFRMAPWAVRKLLIG
ncbi:lycopene cyclase family protein [Amycolatopsis xylanica]|uniref:lycopene cyclase family protein n=1 Tax=Amycolatopsis xylanica TaxID=589385 RepID=UPI000B82921B|nr:lycopene cyclase family protein [Amycolatopsis xylanica]